MVTVCLTVIGEFDPRHVRQFIGVSSSGEDKGLSSLERGFESRYPSHTLLAQWKVFSPSKRQGVGSSPTESAN
jgi:hypothetical protein